MSDGAATCILADEETAFKLTDHPVKITGVGRARHDAHVGSAARRGAPRAEREEERLQEPEISRGPLLPAGRSAGLQAYKMAGVTDPLKQIDFVELHDAYTSSEIQTYEDSRYASTATAGSSSRQGIPSCRRSITG